MSLYLYNTLTRQIEEFKPLYTSEVGLYTCGPTVYNYAHIGNLRTYIFEDILKRVLEYNDYQVKHVMNITDVGHLTDDADSGEDKMEKGAAREKKSVWDIAEFYTEEFKKDLAALNIQEPTIWCKATDHIQEQIDLVKKLEQKGFTYRTSDGIYFDTSKLVDYGKLANLKNQDLQAGVRVDMGEKKNLTDFALWKFSPEGKQRQMEWDSPWSKGFPGWHIECSAMATKYLGQPFDIHCGGIDHIPVHHTNEIAQSEAAEGKPLANYWMHGEFLLIGTDKMAKSGDNFITLNILKQTINEYLNKYSTSLKNPALAYRYFLLEARYRKAIRYSKKAIWAATAGYLNLVLRISHILNDGSPPMMDNYERNVKFYNDSFLEYINDDLDMPAARRLIIELARDKSQEISYKDKISLIKKFDEVLGLDLINEAIFQNEQLRSKKESFPEHINKLIEERRIARASKDWKKSDELRKELEDLGYKVEDTKDGTQVSK